MTVKDLSSRVTLTDILDKENEKGIFNLLPAQSTFSLRASKIPPEILNLSDKVLENRVKPDALLRKIKLSFWDEYNLALKENRKMNIATIYWAHTYKERWVKYVEECPATLAWLLTPPTDYMMQMRQMLYLGLNRMQEIMEMSCYDEKGKVNTKILAEQIKVFKIIDDRVRGSIVHKVQVESRNVHHLQTDPGGPVRVVDVEGDRLPDIIPRPIESLEQIEAKLAEIAAKEVVVEAQDLRAAPGTVGKKLDLEIMEGAYIEEDSGE